MQFHSLRVQQVIDETSDARSFVLEVPSDLAGEFGYRSGQFLTFRIAHDGAELIRCYSLASSPDADGGHKVTVKRVEDGRVSNWFNDRLAAGDAVEVMPPAGRFTLRDSEAPVLLFAGGSGITPVISLMKSALATTGRRIRLLYANRDEASVIFRAELDALRAAHPERLEVSHHLDAERGFVGPSEAAAQLVGFEDAHCYVCGPTPFMDVVEAALGMKGVGPERVFIERFESPADGEMPAVELGADVVAPDELVVHLGGTTHRVPYEKGQSILAAVRAAGLEAPFACEEGYCGSCAAKRIEGEVVMATNDVFDAREVEEGWILTCQGCATGGACEVNYDA